MTKGLLAAAAAVTLALTVTTGANASDHGRRSFHHIRVHPTFVGVLTPFRGTWNGGWHHGWVGCWDTPYRNYPYSYGGWGYAL